MSWITELAMVTDKYLSNFYNSHENLAIISCKFTEVCLTSWDTTVESPKCDALKVIVAKSIKAQPRFDFNTSTINFQNNGHINVPCNTSDQLSNALNEQTSQDEVNSHTSHLLFFNASKRMWNHFKQDLNNNWGNNLAQLTYISATSTFHPTLFSSGKQNGTNGIGRNIIIWPPGAAPAETSANLWAGMTHCAYVDGDPVE
jgi:hypothetical protein